MGEHLRSVSHFAKSTKGPAPEHILPYLWILLAKVDFHTVIDKHLKIKKQLKNSPGSHVTFQLQWIKDE